MAEAVGKQGGSIWSTPLRDLVRGRVTGRLGWRARLLAAALPGPATQLISRVVRRTRLWRLEKLAVVDELIAHFDDGLASGADVAELIERFGDERLAAKLVRRAKRRGRPLVWHAWSFVCRAAVVLLAIYAVLFIRFWTGRPSPSVDYMARLNQPILSTAESDRAWPIYRQAILALTEPGTHGRQFSEILVWLVKKPAWSDRIRWLDANSTGIDLVRQAARKTSLGFIFGSRGSQSDPALGSSFEKNASSNEPLIAVGLPHLRLLRGLAIALTLDVRRGSELHDDARVLADVRALSGLSRQLRGSNGFLVTDLVALGIDTLMVDLLQRMLSQYPSTLTDAQLIEIAHQLAGPQVAADLVNVGSERMFFEDAVQRMYTDDGHGNGRLTLQGMQTLPISTLPTNYDGSSEWTAVTAIVPMIGASRFELMAKYDRLLGRAEANYRQPVRLADWAATEAEIYNVTGSIFERLRYLPITVLLPSLGRAQAQAERYLGQRDGTLVAISLELYLREHGQYPSTLGELTPRFLPAVPVDRITGDPVNYRLIDGKPVVYSVGIDRIDDGGTPPKKFGINGRRESAAEWSGRLTEFNHGDWVLYPKPDLDQN